MCSATRGQSSLRLSNRTSEKERLRSRVTSSPCPDSLNMAHIFSAAVSKISTKKGGEGGVSSTQSSGGGTRPPHHQPGVSPPLSPQNLRDEEIELTSPKAVAPRPASPEIALKRSGSAYNAADKGKGKARAADGSQDGVTSPTDEAPELHRALSTSTSFAMGGVITPRYEESDPLLLRSKLVDETDLRRRPTNSGRKAVKDVKKFYEDQNEHIERLLKPMHAHKQSDEDDRRDNAIKVS